MKKNLSRLFAIFITALLLLTSCTSTTMSDFTVTFNGNGGTLISGTEVQKVQNASEIVPPTYERIGYNFDGWNKNINTISVDTIVNAKWLEKSQDTSLSITGFSQDGSLFSSKVNNNVNIFSYTDKVVISSKSSWKLFSDIEGKIEVVTKTISLSIGDNTNYILVTSENGEYAFYTVVTRRLNMFTVSFDTDGGTIIPNQQVQEESLIQEVPNPEKPHYTFSSWDYDFSEPVMRNMTVTASYTINKYEITFKNYDGTTLQKSDWDYNSTPVYYGSTPIRDANAQYSYTFSGWSPAVTAVTGNQTYSAQFTNTTRTYTIIWKNYNGTTIETDTNVAYGVTPTYNRATPTKAGDSQYSYTFSGWSPAVTAVTGNQTYTAQFSSSINSYTITWQNYDGTTLEVDNDVPYGTLPTYNGTTPSKTGSAQYCYTFSGWSPEIVSVTANATYTAKLSSKINSFGSYPQTIVTDSTLIATLNTAGGMLPTSTNSQTWTSYRYYISVLDHFNLTDFMWYKDVTNGADKYRGVYFTSYRPYNTISSSSTSTSYQDDNGYYIKTSYWFKYEPISWDVLSVDETGGPLVMADKILDSRDYYHLPTRRNSGDATVYPNNYKESDIRSWLNNDFYNQAFSAIEQSSINTTAVDNSVASTGYTTNYFACENTSDKIFLPSYVEAANAAYGLSTQTSRIRQATDYAKAMGVCVYTSNGSSRWWLRSPAFFDWEGYYAKFINNDGDIDYTYHDDDGIISNFVNLADYGVLPAFRINR